MIGCGMPRARSAGLIPFRDNRQLSGLESAGRSCEEAAIFIVDPITKLDTPVDDPNWESTYPDWPEPLKAHAHSVSAYAYYRKYIAGQEKLQEIARDAQYFPRPGIPPADDTVENIFMAAKHATYAATGNFLSPAVLLAGFALRALVEQLQIDMALLKEYRPLWRALERCRKEWSAVGSPVFRMKSVTCAGTGCGAATTKGKPRFTCPACLYNQTPTYCSVECRHEVRAHSEPL